MHMNIKYIANRIYLKESLINSKRILNELIYEFKEFQHYFVQRLYFINIFFTLNISNKCTL